jgi:ABC-type antimicrobial peptide transport system permease subunit
LGLFGLATFTVEARTKEIGIRKVMGASTSQIVGLISKDFLKLVLLAFVIASPLAWLATQQWLQNFAYRIELSVWIFLFSGILAVLVAFLTVAYQAFGASRANPVDSLRCE